MGRATVRFRLLYAWLVIVLNEDPLRRLLRVYVEYANTDRVHIQLRESPACRPTEHSTRPERAYAHDWQVGDLIVFDLVDTMHRREGWTTGGPRFMRQLGSVC